MAIESVVLIMQGTEYPLTYNSTTQKYTATITAPSASSYNQTGGYYALQIKATDDAGNVTTIDTTHATLGDDLKLVVKETTKPTITIVSPTSGAKLSTNAPTITFKVTDAGSGVNVSSAVLKVDGTTITGVTSTAITNGYQFTVTASGLSDGSHTITVNASDNDGNAGTQKTATFTTDTTLPDLNITAPTNNLVTSSRTVAYAGTTNDVTTSPVTLTYQIKLGQTTSSSGTITVGNNGAFSGDFTLPETDGTYTLIFTSTDSAGNATTVERTVTLNRSPPVITAVTISPNPVNTSQTFTITVTVTDT